MQSAFFKAAITTGFFLSASLITQSPALAAPAHPAPVSSKQICDESVMPSCAAISKSKGLNAAKDPALGFGTQRDGGVIFNSLSHFHRSSDKDPVVAKGLYDEEAKQSTSNASSEDLKKRMKPILDAAIDVVKNGNAELSPEQKLLIERINTVSFAIAENRQGSDDAKNFVTRDESLCKVDVPLGFPNAGYQDSEHTILVCPATMNVTMKQFIHTMAHEIGHVVSPCMERSQLYNVDAEQTWPGPIEQCSHAFLYDENESRGAQNDTVATLMASKPPHMVSRPSPLNKQIEGCGIMKSSPSSSVEKPKLYAKTMACLAKTYAVTYKDAETKYVFSKMKEQTPASTARNDYENASPPYCQRIAEEHFADSFEAKVVGRIAQQQAWTKKDYQAALFTQAGFVCSEKEGHKYSIADYPDAHTRIETAMNDAATRDQLGCEAAPQDLCPVVISPENAPKTASQTATSKPRTSSGARSQK